MIEQKPSVGRMVHYVSHGTPTRPDGTRAYTEQCRAAIVTEVEADDSTVGLCVLNPTGQFFNRDNRYDAGIQDGGPGLSDNLCDGRGHQGGTWHWPARV